VKIPFEPLVVIGGDAGKPHFMEYPDSATSQALQQVATAVIAFNQEK
jgi:MinD-like ATPase involved in chromosome partitioning or flagellar assembly